LDFLIGHVSRFAFFFLAIFLRGFFAALELTFARKGRGLFFAATVCFASALRTSQCPWRLIERVLMLAVAVHFRRDQLAPMKFKEAGHKSRHNREGRNSVWMELAVQRFCASTTASQFKEQ
jgi:hypothetical protein